MSLSCFSKMFHSGARCRILLGALWVIGATILETGCSQSVHSSKPAPSKEEETYLQAITLTDARMSAAQNFLADTVTYLDARVTNRGSRLVRRLDIQLEFHDLLKQVVLREKAHLVSLRTQPLKAGEARSFRVTFEHLPTDWDGLPPTMVATRVEF